MQGVREAAAEGKLVIGICNGFQVLTESGLLPGALLRNDHLQFRCELVDLTVHNVNTPFTAAYTEGQTVKIPIAHGEGRYVADEETLRTLERERRIVFTYRRNPNGSALDIAGILNERGNVLGMMPHPERAVADWMGSADGRALFASMRRCAKEAIHVG
ncbi:hypothetical protein GCM10025857_16690 [Alicyclobacillus contaminans]|nr:hypothetical protein GCM10025857_16690 [Alicyclobacillus contaminans]